MYGVGVRRFRSWISAEAQPSVWCRGLHIPPHCTWCLIGCTDLSYMSHGPIVKHVHIGSDQPHDIPDRKACWDIFALRPRSIKVNMVTFETSSIVPFKPLVGLRSIISAVMSAVSSVRVLLKDRVQTSLVPQQKIRS